MRFLVLCCLLPLWASTDIPQPDVAEMKKPIADWIQQLHINLEGAVVEKFPDLPQRMGELGNLYHGMKRYDTAAKFYKNAATLSPDQPLWPYYQGLLERDRNNLEEAVTFFQATLKLDPEDITSMVRLGNVLLQLGNHEEAAKIFAKAEVKDPESAMIAFGIARAADLQGKTKMAVAYYERALKLQPNADYVNYPLGMAWRKLGDRDKALAYLSKRGETEIIFQDARVDKLSEMVTLATLQVVLAMASDHSVTTRDFVGFVNTNLGGRLGLESYLADAAEDRAVQDPFGAARLHYLTGTILMDAGQRKWASGHFEASMSLKPLPEALTERGIIWALDGKLKLAIEHYDRALTLAPRDLEALFAKANAFVAMGDLGEAHHTLEELLRLEPESVLNHQLMIKTQNLLGNQAEERRYREALLALLPPGNDLLIQHLRLAALADAMGDSAAAASHREKLKAMEPNDEAERLNLAGRLALDNDYTYALALYEKVLAGNPKQVNALMGRYACHVLAKRFKEALASLEAAYKATNDPGIAHLLSRFLSAGPIAEAHDGERALRLAQIGYDAVHDLPEAEAIAMAQARLGQYDDARRLQAQLISEAAKAYGTKKAMIRLRANLQYYIDRKPCCAESVDAISILLPPE